MTLKFLSNSSDDGGTILKRITRNTSASVGRTTLRGRARKKRERERGREKSVLPFGRAGRIMLRQYWRDFEIRAFRVNLR